MKAVHPDVSGLTLGQRLLRNTMIETSASRLKKKISAKNGVKVRFATGTVLHCVIKEKKLLTDFSAFKNLFNRMIAMKKLFSENPIEIVRYRAF